MEKCIHYLLDIHKTLPFLLLNFYKFQERLHNPDKVRLPLYNDSNLVLREYKHCSRSRFRSRFLVLVLSLLSFFSASLFVINAKKQQQIIKNYLFSNNNK
jgi:hypothetical protein